MLKETQDQLIVSEKMAGLGTMVKGVAHEMNTPLGTALTSASYLESIINALKAAYESQSLSKKFFHGQLDKGIESLRIMMVNLRKTSALIEKFKDVAMATTQEEAKETEILPFVESILLTIKGLEPYDLNLNIPKNLTLRIIPSVMVYIVYQFIENSIKHGFEDNQEGRIYLEMNKKSDTIQMIYEDNGKGIPQDIISKIYEPFFTTARNKGGTGLGLHGVYNAVIFQLGGEIICESDLGKGARFIIKWQEPS